MSCSWFPTSYIVGSTIVEVYFKTLKEAVRSGKSVQDMNDDDNERNDDEILESHGHDFLEAAKDFVICDDEEDVFLGPEIKVAQTTTYLHCMSLHFYDHKKILWFYISGLDCSAKSNIKPLF
jgi:hypothetical protein